MDEIIEIIDRLMRPDDTILLPAVQLICAFSLGVTFIIYQIGEAVTSVIHGHKIQESKEEQPDDEET